MVALVILDGWGIAPPGPGNAIDQADTVNIKRLSSEYLYTQLIAHGESVGLPKGEPGNTETGHLNIGAGRIVYQDLPRINMSIADGTFFLNGPLLNAIRHAQTNNSNLHIMGLVGGGGVHSEISHLFALLRMCREQNFDRVFVHVFTDGRDSPPQASLTYINQLQKTMQQEGLGKIASVTGRYYAMDRDYRWDRTALTYFCLTRGEGNKADSVEQAINSSYVAGITDEFIKPTCIVENGKPVGIIKNKDSAIFFNYRIDRPRQLTKAFVLSDFEKSANKLVFDPYSVKYHQKHDLSSTVSQRQIPFERGAIISDLNFVTLTEYEEGLLTTNVAFPPQIVEFSLGEVVSRAGLRQIRIAESEKERFVTYYFNGQTERVFEEEERQIESSTKVSTYDKKPEMSSSEITEDAIKAIQSRKYDLLVMNFANPDMVGHTGNIAAAVKSCKATDVCVAKIAEEVLKNNNDILVITADHGNVEEMINRITSLTDTEHNANPVPFIIVGQKFKIGKRLAQGLLADVAPTILSLLKIPRPGVMTGRNLLADYPGL